MAPSIQCQHQSKSPRGALGPPSETPPSPYPESRPSSSSSIYVCMRARVPILYVLRADRWHWGIAGPGHRDAGREVDRLRPRAWPHRARCAASRAADHILRAPAPTYSVLDHSGAQPVPAALADGAADRPGRGGGAGTEEEEGERGGEQKGGAGTPLTRVRDGRSRPLCRKFGRGTRAGEVAGGGEVALE